VVYYSSPSSIIYIKVFVEEMKTLVQKNGDRLPLNALFDEPVFAAGAAPLTRTQALVVAPPSAVACPRSVRVFLPARREDAKRARRKTPGEIPGDRGRRLGNSEADRAAGGRFNCQLCSSGGCLV
jgi:hypothetical protein